MRKWTKKKGAPPRPPRVRIHEESVPLMFRLARKMKREPADVIHLSMRFLAAALDVKVEQAIRKMPTRGGNVSHVPVAQTARRMIERATRRKANAKSKY